MAYDINYEDERFAQVENDKQTALSEVEQAYGGMMDKSNAFYQAQIDASNQWGETQKQLQQKQTDFAIEQIEQQKEQAKKDYTKEQSGAYVDWQKQSNKYGANAEQMAASGLSNTGYSESSQVAMYNTYQNRVASARESYNRAVLNYDNAIKEAQLQNNSVLAEIAYESLQKQLELSLQGFQYENQLVLDKLSRKTEIDNAYYGRYQDVLNQINTENALAEQIRQYNESLAEERRQYDASLAQNQAQWEKEYELSQAKLEEEQRQYDASLVEEQRQFDIKYPGSLGIQKDGNTGVSKSLYTRNVIDYGQPSGNSSKAENKGNYEVSTPYYQGERNGDVDGWGAFENGYQPKGIYGHGKLKKTGETTQVTKVIQYGEDKGKEVVATQNIWEAADGTRWIWNSMKNCYQEA